MHYYQFNIGDYKTHTGHLTPIEDICYRRLLDFYYLHEKPLNQSIDKLARLLLLSDYEKELNSVINEYFILTDDGYINNRADKEIKQYQSFIESGKQGAAKRWCKPPYTPPNQPPMPNNNHKPLTTNQDKTIVSNNVANCPHDEIIKLYAKNLPMLMQVKIWSEKRKRLLKARWGEDAKRQNIDWWQKFFTFIAKSDFLTGKATDWQADIEWILNSANFIKILEGKYENKNG